MSTATQQPIFRGMRSSERWHRAAIPRRTSTQTYCEQLAQFQAFTVAHPHLVTAKESLITAIRESEPNSIVMVFGPTGVGKTTLRLRTEQILIEELRPELDANRWCVPVASVEAIAPDSGSFCWRSHFQRLLQAMGDPLTDRRRVCAKQWVPVGRHLPGLREAVRAALCAGRT
jgi:hypothetical protein